MQQNHRSSILVNLQNGFHLKFFVNVFHLEVNWKSIRMRMLCYELIFVIGLLSRQVDSPTVIKTLDKKFPDFMLSRMIDSNNFATKVNLLEFGRLSECPFSQTTGKFSLVDSFWKKQCPIFAVAFCFFFIFFCFFRLSNSSKFYKSSTAYYWSHRPSVVLERRIRSPESQYIT